MLQLHSYLDRINEIKWYFNDMYRRDLESLLFVEFERIENYYVIKKVKYTYIDILLALEEMDFEIIKTNKEIRLKILNI